MWPGIFSLTRYTWRMAVTVLGTILFVTLLVIPGTRWLAVGSLALLGPLAAYGGLLALVLGRIGVASAFFVAVGLGCGTVAVLASTTALALASSPLLGVAVGASLCAVVFAVAGFSGRTTTSRRFVPPVDTE